MKTLTKAQFRKFAEERNCITKYSGKLKKHFITRLEYLGKIDVHRLINNKIVS